MNEETFSLRQKDDLQSMIEIKKEDCDNNAITFNMGGVVAIKLTKDKFFAYGQEIDDVNSLYEHLCIWLERVNIMEKTI